MDFCNSCGIKIEPHWEICPNCGTILIAKGDTLQTDKLPSRAPSRSTKNLGGSIAVVSGLLTFILFQLYSTFRHVYEFFIVPPLTGSFIAIICGILGIKFDKDTTMGKLGLALGILGFVFYLVMVFIVMPVLEYIRGP